MADHGANRGRISMTPETARIITGLILAVVVIIMFAAVIYGVANTPVEPGICPNCRKRRLPDGMAECDSCFGERHI